MLANLLLPAFGDLPVKAISTGTVRNGYNQLGTTNWIHPSQPAELTPIRCYGRS